MVTLWRSLELSLLRLHGKVKGFIVQTQYIVNSVIDVFSASRVARGEKERKEEKESGRKETSSYIEKNPAAE